MTDQQFTLKHANGEVELPVVAASEGASGVDISALLKQTGHVTLDPGYVNTGACTSAITYIDGDAGILRYRGYPIDELAEKRNFLEVSLPPHLRRTAHAGAVDEFAEKIRLHTLLHEDMQRFFDGFPRDAHPMPVLSSAVSALSTFYQDNLDPGDTEPVEISTVRLLAKLPTIAAYAYKKSIGQPLLYPDNSLEYVDNFLRMTFGVPAEPYEVDPAVAKALDLLFILHADHEQNCSTSTVRLVGSSQANLFASVSSGINALSGPLHGGANSAVLSMLEQIVAEGGDVAKLRRAGEEPGEGRPADGLRSPGLQELRPARGDREEDRRRRARPVGKRDPLLEIAMQLEEIALTDDYFVSRKLYPNVDFYTGLIYKRDGLPDQDVHGAVRARPAARLDRPVAGDDGGPGQQDRPSPPALHRRDRAVVRRDGPALAEPGHPLVTTSG